MLKLSCSFDSLRFLLKMLTEWVINCYIFQFLTMFDTTVGTGAVGAGVASRYDSGSAQMMRLLAAPAPQHCMKHCKTFHSSLLLYSQVDQNFGLGGTRSLILFRMLSCILVLFTHYSRVFPLSKI
jgi:hypothetical protein